MSDYLEKVDKTINNGRFKDSWDHLDKYNTPIWYKKMRFGIFVHWGLYTVPAHGSEWYARHMYDRATECFKYHRDTFGDQKVFGYKDFIPLFTAEHFDADEWCDIAKSCGAKYFIPTGEHHDGFQLYESALSKWNSYLMGPKRDFVKELKESAQRHGLVFGVSSHRAEHNWFFYHGTRFESDVCIPEYAGLYGPAKREPYNHTDILDSPPDKDFLEDWLARSCEIVDKYKPKIMYFDWWISNLAFEPYLRKFMAYYYNRADEWGEEVVVNYKEGACPPKTAVLTVERGKLSGISGLVWQSDTSITKGSWGYIDGLKLKSAADIICDIADTVSKNGCVLLNIAPKKDGSIPDNQKRLLKRIGEWLRCNGEAIYDTEPWKIYGESVSKFESGRFSETDSNAYTYEDIRFTQKDKFLYIIFLKHPEGNASIIKSLGKSAIYDVEKIYSIHTLEKNIALEFQHEEDALVIKDIKIPNNGLPVVLKVRMG